MAQPSAGPESKTGLKGQHRAGKPGAARAIAKALGTEPMTVREINAALGADYAALQVSNAVSFLPGVAPCKVMRTVVYRRGKKMERAYTAYFYEKAAGTTEDR